MSGSFWSHLQLDNVPELPQCRSLAAKPRTNSKPNCRDCGSFQHILGYTFNFDIINNMGIAALVSLATRAFESGRHRPQTQCWIANVEKFLPIHCVPAIL